jgi:hypothetical protein
VLRANGRAAFDLAVVFRLARCPQVVAAHICDLFVGMRMWRTINKANYVLTAAALSSPS